LRILFLTHRVPFPLDRGDRIRAYHLLRFLASRADVSLACVSQETTPDASRKALAALCERVAIEPTSRSVRAVHSSLSLLAGGSATEGYFWSPLLNTTLTRWAEDTRFDAVVCFCSGMYRYCVQPSLSEVPTIVDVVDVDSQKWSECAANARMPFSWIRRWESHRVAKLERRIAAFASDIFLISEDERSLFQRVTGHSAAAVATNGVDIEHFGESLKSHPEPRTCVFLGVLNYQPNVDAVMWFARHIWPGVRCRFTDARLRIVGRNPTAEVQALSKCAGIEVNANVPDVRPYLANSEVAVAPLRIARGVQNKVLESMAAGLPVVATPAALAGLKVEKGSDAICADSVDEWQSAIETLFTDTERRRLIAANGRAYVEKHHNWNQTLTPFGDALARVDACYREHDPSVQRHEGEAKEMCVS